MASGLGAELVVAFVAMAQEALIILYTRGIAGGRVGTTMVVSGTLALMMFYVNRVVVLDPDMQVAATLGHVMGVPIGMGLPVSFGTEDPKRG